MTAIKERLKWDGDFATGSTGTQYAIHSESYDGRHGGRGYALMTWIGGRWIHVKTDRDLKSKQAVKRLADHLEQTPKPRGRK